MKKPRSIYFDRYAWTPDLLDEEERVGNPDLVVVLPAYKETNLLAAVKSLLACNAPAGEVCIIVLVNEPENAPGPVQKTNQEAYDQLKALKNGLSSTFQLIIKRSLLPPKKAGVGLARKIGMDAAARWFAEKEKDGVIICFDADTTCQPNYLQAIEEFYQGEWQAGLVAYAHPLESNGIIEYESHLRYYAAGLRFAGFPFPFQTLGSCITVRSDAYLRHGGMNTRKAGEDFYFLHKIFPHESVSDIVGTTLYPAARLSDRVPFGTGKALEKYQKSVNFLTYNPTIFSQLNELLTHRDTLLLEKNELSQEVKSYLKDTDLSERLLQLRANCADDASYRARFFQVFDGFRVLKFVHYMRDRFFPMVPVPEALIQLNTQLWKIEGFENMAARDRLSALRQWDQTHPVSYKVK